jgi:hypothetical protein
MAKSLVGKDTRRAMVVSHLWADLDTEVCRWGITDICGAIVDLCEEDNDETPSGDQSPEEQKKVALLRKAVEAMQRIDEEG